MNRTQEYIITIHPTIGVQLICISYVGTIVDFVVHPVPIYVKVTDITYNQRTRDHQTNDHTVTCNGDRQVNVFMLLV